ncbi:MAG: succinylglutamate desuccinylase/aspartoacylase family protein [Lunatimonas sp.]|uniref:succinylglutamate desuccinylase/aspartoacylase domain-containing protein n=1 Tax=Lunatimonas sp. TaxID=2060141 RepID=UPI00263BA4A9|nr:succinylglutamate desuccinylase/aspartoacylase family protein [Lunatimonas sp.]MCC5938472.1 succinylglutamate desuccinylase/aspartoacylase family protein [Lunatimonas sp.]
MKPEKQAAFHSDQTSLHNRTLYRVEKGPTDPTMVVFVGMHGNEKASIQAVEEMVVEGRLSSPTLLGNLFVLIGNKKALSLGRRFIDKDFNRIWTAEHLHRARTETESNWPPTHELAELKELDTEISEIIRKYGAGRLCFLDLHTTSAESGAFLPFNDSLANRQLAERFPVPLILGIEEFLEGPLMSHINNLGFPALGFEAGRHGATASILRHRAFLELALCHWGIKTLSDGEKSGLEKQLSESLAIPSGFYEIRYRHDVRPMEGFAMDLGYINFQPVTKGQRLASDKQGVIYAPYTGLMFMPLYQVEGSDGFFIIRRVSRFWLVLSKWLRRAGISELIAWLPGVEKDPVESAIYWVNPRIARFFHREIFHLLGYRIKQEKRNGAIRIVRRG